MIACRVSLFKDNIALVTGLWINISGFQERIVKITENLTHVYVLADNPQDALKKALRTKKEKLTNWIKRRI